MSCVNFITISFNTSQFVVWCVADVLATCEALIIVCQVNGDSMSKTEMCLVARVGDLQVSHSTSQTHESVGTFGAYCLQTSPVGIAKSTFVDSPKMFD